MHFGDNVKKRENVAPFSPTSSIVFFKVPPLPNSASVSSIRIYTKLGLPARALCCKRRSNVTIVAQCGRSNNNDDDDDEDRIIKQGKGWSFGGKRHVTDWLVAREVYVRSSYVCTTLAVVNMELKGK